jgi:hypothetical protein
MKQYEVGIYSPCHGRYGCKFYFGLVLSCNSKEAAKDFAFEIVSNMTKREFNERCIDEKPFIWESELDQKVDVVYADCLSYRASKFLG